MNLCCLHKGWPIKDFTLLTREPLYNEIKRKRTPGLPRPPPFPGPVQSHKWDAQRDHADRAASTLGAILMADCGYGAPLGSTQPWSHRGQPHLKVLCTHPLTWCPGPKQGSRKEPKTLPDSWSQRGQRDAIALGLWLMLCTASLAEWTQQQSWASVGGGMCGYSLKEPPSRARRLWVARVKESQEEMHRFFQQGR